MLGGRDVIQLREYYVLLIRPSSGKWLQFSVFCWYEDQAGISAASGQPESRMISCLFDACEETGVG